MTALATTSPLTYENINFLKQCKNRAEWLHESNRKLNRNLFPSTEETLGPILLRQKEDLQFIEPLVEQLTFLMHNLYQAAKFEDNINLMADIDQLYFGLEYSGPSSKLNEIPTTEKLLTELATLSEQLSKYKTPEGDFDLYGIDTTVRHQGSPREIEEMECEEMERRQAQDEQDDRDDMTISRVRSMYRSMSLTQIADHYNRFSSSWSPYIKSEIKKYLGMRR
jgi:hypothetical protein